MHRVAQVQQDYFARSLMPVLLLASEDFDGGAVNLISGCNPATGNLDGGSGDWFGVGNLGSWPQSNKVPFVLADGCCGY